MRSHRTIDRCECGHSLDVHWNGEAHTLWCSAPGCTCRKAGREQPAIDSALMSEEPTEMVRMVQRTTTEERMRRAS